MNNPFDKNTDIDIVGLGHAPVDVIFYVEDNFLKCRDYEKAVCVTIDEETEYEFRETFSGKAVIEPGGSVANILSGVSLLGGRCIFNSRLSDDTEGQTFRNSLDKSKVTFSGQIIRNALSDKVYTFVTPDRERTFAAFHGVSLGLCIDDIDANAIKNASILCLEGYMFNSPEGFNVMVRSIEIAQEHQTKIAFVPNDKLLIKENPKKISYLIEKADILIMNEAEAKAVSLESDIEKAVKFVYENSRYGAVTLGAQGAFFFSKELGEQPFHLSAPQITQEIKNTNGAGDQFSAGFLYGICKGKDFISSCKLALECGTASLYSDSARLEPEYIENLIT